MGSVAVWTILSIIAAVGLILSWRGPNVVRGATTFGLIGGLITAGVYHFIDSGFRWATVGKGVVVSVLAGLATELIWRITRRNSNWDTNGIRCHGYTTGRDFADCHQ